MKKVIVYLGRDKTMQLLEELVSELQLTDPVSSGVTHMDNPPYYRITSSYKSLLSPQVRSRLKLITLYAKRSFPQLFILAGVCFQRPRENTQMLSHRCN